MISILAFILITVTKDNMAVSKTSWYFPHTITFRPSFYPNLPTLEATYVICRHIFEDQQMWLSVTVLKA